MSTTAAVYFGLFYVKRSRNRQPLAEALGAGIRRGLISESTSS